MNSAIPKPCRRKEAGYTLLMAVFLLATMAIASLTLTENVLTRGQREREEEMVWRGNQYARAIGLYYGKIGRYPTKIEDLTRQTNGMRFLRQAYKDPMNKEDGSWRFIYAGANGQLIGSLRPTNLLQSALSTPGIGGLTPFGSMQQPLAPGAAVNQQTGIGAGPGQQTNTAANGAPGANPLESQPQPLDGTIVGGNIAGVGSKIKKPSLRVYMGGDTYQQWEFIWTPAGQIAPPVQAPANPNANPTVTPGGTPPNGTGGPQQQGTQTPPTN
jgi:type II secretory pathway pseudopilin PulG